MMFEFKQTMRLDQSVGMLAQNLQVLSLDCSELYLGTIRRNCFLGVSNSAKAATINVETKTKIGEEQRSVAITDAKWCSIDLGTILVIGTRYDVRFLDWSGRNELYRFDFESHGLLSKDNSSFARGIASFGSNNVAIGLRSGVILNFRVMKNDENKLCCKLIDSCRMHSEPIVSLASNTLNANNELIVSVDDNGLINVWSNDNNSLRHLVKYEAFLGTSITTIILKSSTLILGFGNGKLRLLSLLPQPELKVEIDAHAAAITGLDHAQNKIVSVSEDGFIRIWTLKNDFLEHNNSIPLCDFLLTGIKFLGEKDDAFAVAAYDRDELLVYSKRIS